MNTDYKHSLEKFNAFKAQCEDEIEAIQLTKEEIDAAIKLAKTHKWRLLRNETPDFKAPKESLSA